MNRVTAVAVAVEFTYYPRSYVYAILYINSILALTRKIINHSSILERLGVNTLTRACA